MFIKKKLKSNITLIAEPLNNFHSVTIGIWVNAGSKTETPSQNGISHFIEHMMFKGTKKRSAKQIAIDVDNIGGQINAFTSKECTCYYIKIMDEKLCEGIEILTDLFCNATLDKDELEKERGVILEEIAMSNDSPEDVAMDLIAATFFDGCSLAKTILGPPSNIEKFSRDDLMNYINARYTSDNIIISVVGNFDEDKLVYELDKTLDVIQNSVKNEPFMNCTDFVNVQGFATESKDIEQVHICLGLPSYDLKNKKRYALQILNNTIGGSMSSRLFQKIREELGLAYSVYSHPVLYRDTGMHLFYAGTMSQNALNVSELIKEELYKVRKEGITKAEFEQSKEQLKGNFVLSLESTSSKMSSLGKSLLLTDNVYTDDEVLKFIKDVTFEDVQQVIEEIIKPDDLTATYVGKVDEIEKLKGITMNA